MPWHPRMWHGMTMGAWLKTLARHRPAISPSRWVLAGTISMSTPISSALAALQQMLYGRRIRSLAIDKAPIFILGHWRSGTTLLHELLVLDERHTCPNTYACYTPRHFLVSRYLVPWWLKFLMPSRRPMDNMKVGWDRPQEDEFALCNMGIPSPYMVFAFPNIPDRTGKCIRRLRTCMIGCDRTSDTSSLPCVVVQKAAHAAAILQDDGRGVDAVAASGHVAFATRMEGAPWRPIVGIGHRTLDGSELGRLGLPQHRNGVQQGARVRV